MRHLVLLAALAAAAAPAGAETFDCRMTRTCTTTGNACFDDPEAVTVALTIADDGQSARLSAGEGALEMALVDAGPASRTFLAVRAGEGAGLFSLAADGTLAASSTEIDGEGLIGITSSGSCMPRNG